MRVAIRVDASIQIGTGHFMRCLTLADALRQRGGTVCFVSRHLPPYLRDMLATRGHAFTVIGKDDGSATQGRDPVSWLGVSQAEDARACRQAFAGEEWDWLVVDHYAIDAEWEQEMRGAAARLLVIDDLADRTHDCDVLLDQNEYEGMSRRYAGKVPTNCRQLLGPRFALLRDEFRMWRDRVAIRSGPVRRLLVFFGGADATNCTGRALEALSGLDDALQVDVVIGAQHPCRRQIEAACTGTVTCHVQTSRMAELMAAADLSLGAAGSASWERCCLALPALTLSLADNQTEIARSIDRRGAGWYLGTDAEVDVAILRSAIRELLDDPSRISKMSHRAYELVDGNGTGRLCAVLKE